MTSQEIAAAAIKVIQENGWSKGKGIGDSGQLCIGFSLQKAAELDPGLLFYPEEQPGLRDLRAAVEETLVIVDDLFPGRSYRCGVRCVPFFNDHPDTTEADVLLVLKHLAES